MSKCLKFQQRQRSASGDPPRLGDTDDGVRRRNRTVLSKLRSKLTLTRQRSAQQNVRDCSQSHPALTKSSTLPARIPYDAPPRSSYHRSPLWSVDSLEASEEVHLPGVGSDDESVDSGLDHRAGDGSESDSSPRQPKPTNSIYDEIAVRRAFGAALKDVGRWYSSQHQLQLRQNRSSRDDLAERERLGSRPPLPLPHEGVLKAAKVSQDSVLVEMDQDLYQYERIQPRLLGTNGLMLGLRDLARHGWYWGPLTRLEAEEKLQGLDNGMFLVRDSSDDRYFLSLSFRSQGKTLHTRIEYCNGHFSFYSFPDSENEGYSSVVELIEQSMEYSSMGVFCFSRARTAGSPAVPVRLLKPLSRFNQVRSLQHYCRFVIRQNIRFDTIRQLPLPRHVHNYLEQCQF